MKAYYISKEAIKQDIKITWIRLSGGRGWWRRDGIDIVSFSSRLPGILRSPYGLIRALIFCKSRGVTLVYTDEWLFFRGTPLFVLFTQLVLRMLRIGFILDQRDPFVDFQIATENIQEGTLNYRGLSFVYKLIYKFANLVILPSEEYKYIRMKEDGESGHNLLGEFRGIDTDSFKLDVDHIAIRNKLHLDGKFVIGWFGIMHPFRQIRQVLIPLIERVRDEIPNAMVVIGGNGPLKVEFEDLMRRDPNVPLIDLGFVPYSALPQHLAACDVLLCPMSTEFRFTRSSLWLKVIESLAVGRPILVTSTPACRKKFGDLDGIIWVENNDPDKFLNALKDVQINYQKYKEQVESQTSRLDEYTTLSSIPRILERVLKATSN